MKPLTDHEGTEYPRLDDTELQKLQRVGSGKYSNHTTQQSLVAEAMESRQVIAELKQELLTAADVLDWGAEGLQLIGKSKLRTACDRVKKLVNER